ncbi:MAG: hypothetical protein U9M90_01330 [Patescibacteria group bacterium]|nr:hypothetical protein [Patescibacteria group bacterium]
MFTAKLQDHLQRNWSVYVLCVIILAAFFIRSVNFHDWLYFKADQARDAAHSRSVLNNGPGELPLLGPKAGGTKLHLGPVYYYFQYFSALIFQSAQPHIFALPDLFFSILAIPLFYYFLRQFFSKEISLLTITTFSFSYIITQYSRFGWNPNLVPFWGLLFVLSVYKVGTISNKKTAGYWLLSAAIAYSVVSQLHFIALAGFPLVAVIFWLFWRPRKIPWKFWVGAVLIVLIIYAPVIISDVKNKGNNLEQFHYAIKHKPQERSVLDSARKTTELYGKFYAVIVTSLNDNELPIISSIGIFFVLASFIVMTLLVFGKLPWFKSAKYDPFLTIILIWFVSFSIIYFQLAFSLNRNRYWFPTIFIPYIFLSMFYAALWKIKYKKIGITLVLTITLLLLILNLSAIANWYCKLHSQQNVDRFFRTVSSTSLKQREFVTLKDQKEIVAYMKNISEQKNKQACFNAPGVYLPAIKYVFETNHPNFPMKRIGENISKNTNGCEIFIIELGRKNEKSIYKKFPPHINVNTIEKHQAGFLTAWRVSYSENNSKKSNTKKTGSSTNNAVKNKKNYSNTEPIKKPSLHWKDVF